MQTRLIRRRPSRGTMLVIALVMLMFLLLLGAALTRATILFHRQGAGDERQQQAFLLSESGIQRAIHAIRTKPDYRGETWRVSAETFGDSAEGEVTIRVESPSTEVDVRHRVIIEAVYPSTGAQRFISRRELDIRKDSLSKPPAADAVN